MTCGGSDALHERMNRSLDAPAGLGAPGLTRASSSWWMVGTAEYQVAPTSCATPQKDSGLNLAGTTTVPPVDERGQRRGHEPVDVEQRHDAQRHVVGRERVAAGDVAGRDRQVGVRQRHPLGPAGAAARVEHERRLVERGHRHGCARGHARTGVTVPLASMSTVRIGTVLPAARRASSMPSGGSSSTLALVSSR